MTSQDVKRAAVLIQAIIAAKEWRETFEESAGAEHEQVEFSDIRLTPYSLNSNDAETSTGFEGMIALLRPDAIAMMNWLETYAKVELEKMGVETVEAGGSAP